MGHIYQITNTVNGKFYIGSTKNISKRMSTHFRQLKKGTHHSIYLQRSFDKYGIDAFEYCVIEECPDNILLSREEEILTEINPPYNMTTKASGGYLIEHHPDRERLIEQATNRLVKYAKSDAGIVFRKSRTGEKNSNWRGGENTCSSCGRSVGYRNVDTCGECRDRCGKNNPFYGKMHTKKTKKILHEKMKGKLPSNTQRVSIDGVEYESMTSAAKCIGVACATIMNRVNSEKFPTYIRVI